MNYPFSGVLVRFKSNDDRLSESSSNELHVNLWDFETKAILDIGVMISINQNLSHVFIDVPWKIDVSKIFDIGSKLDGERILQSIFNRTIIYKSTGTSYPIVEFPDDNSSEKKDFLLIRLNQSQFKVETVNLPGGCESSQIQIKIDSEQIKSQVKDKGIKKFYLRIRLLDVDTRVFSTPYSQKDKNLLSSSIQATVVDFRLNPRRAVPSEVLSPADSKLIFPPFKQIHLFVIVHRDRDPTFQNKSFKACRSLEDENVWNDYIRLDGNNSDHFNEDVGNYLGYQWAACDDGDGLYELVALARFSRVVSNGWLMLRFILVVLLLGAIGNGVWEIFKGYLGGVVTFQLSPEKWSVEFETMFWLGVISLVLCIIPQKILEKINKKVKKILKIICCFCKK